MSFLILKAYLALIQFDLYLACGNFQAVHDNVRRCPLRKLPRLDRALERTCAALDIACIWYPKPALCLQRSAALACLLRANGVSAQLVIGVQQIPFKSHAWVEVNGRVVNDKPYTPEIYSVVERC